jgi:energy-coupling factor transport system permease protein
MRERPGRRPLPGRAFHYRNLGSPLHRLGTGPKLALVAAATSGAVLGEGVRPPLLLLAALFAGYAAAGLSRRDLWQDVRWLCLQGLVVVALSTARDGLEGLASGSLTALRILLFFLPGALLLRTTPLLALVSTARRWLPPRLSLAAATSARFVPYFARELHEIVGAQRLRGARLRRRDLWRPSAWRDWVACVATPVAVRTIHAANEAALAARMRGIDGEEERA